MSKIYLDTSVLLSVVIENHENHQKCLDIFKKGLASGSVLTSATHAYAEMYRTLTRGNSPIEVSPSIAQSTIVEKLVPLMTMVSLDKTDYEAAIARCVMLDLRSSVIYDALHVQAALKAGATVLYTDNLRDFNRLVTDEDDIIVQGIR